MNPNELPRIGLHQFAVRRGHDGFVVGSGQTESEMPNQAR